MWQILIAVSLFLEASHHPRIVPIPMTSAQSLLRTWGKTDHRLSQSLIQYTFMAREPCTDVGAIAIVGSEIRAIALIERANLWFFGTFRAILDIQKEGHI